VYPLDHLTAHRLITGSHPHLPQKLSTPHIVSHPPPTISTPAPMSPDASSLSDPSVLVSHSEPAHEHPNKANRQVADGAEDFGFDNNADLAALATPPKFDGDVEKERAYLKERLAAALRIFAKQGLSFHVVSPLSALFACVLLLTVTCRPVTSPSATPETLTTSGFVVVFFFSLRFFPAHLTATHTGQPLRPLLLPHHRLGPDPCLVRRRSHRRRKAR
jgi:hypothetical protein